MSKHWRTSTGKRTRYRAGRVSAERLRFVVVAATFAIVGYQTWPGPQAAQARGSREIVASLSSAQVIDGDTFRYRGDKIRVADIDAPEVRSRCDEEAELAARATDRFSELLSDGPFVLEPISGRDQDRYGRKLRIVTRNGRSLGDQLVGEGLARTWSGRREAWCDAGGTLAI